MGASGFRRSRWGQRVALLGLLFLVLSPFGYVTGRSLIRLDDPSPAVGRAQVITQGIAQLPDDEYVMRIVRRIAPVLGDAKVGRRALGFAFATDEPILITEVTGDDDDQQYQDVARIAPGEGFLTLEGTRQIRASLGTEPTIYTGIEFVPPDQANDVGTGELIYVSEAIKTPAGQRDLDLVRNVLAQQDIANVPDTGGQILVLATDGAIDILPGRSRSKRLEAGESAIFNAEDLEIRASEDSAYGVPTNQLGSLTNMLQTDDPIAGYLVVVIGPEVPKTGEPTATATFTAEPVLPSVTAVPTEAPVEPTAIPQELGSIGVTGRLCEPGVTTAKITDAQCPVIPDGFDMALSGPSGSFALANANRIDASWYWTELSLGQYGLSASAYPANANDYFIPGSAAIGGSSDGGYTVTLGPGAADIVAPVYFLQPAVRQTTAPVSVAISVCEQGPNGPVNCSSPASRDVDPMPYLVSSNGTTYTWADAQVTRGVYTWTLPADTWTLFQDGWNGDFYVNGTRYSAGSAYIFTTDGTTQVRIDVQDVFYIIQ